MKNLPATLVLLLERYGFVPDDNRMHWRFDGHPSQACTIELIAEERPEGLVYQLSVGAFPGGLGHEDDARFEASQLPELERAIERECEDAREPYVKTRLQKLFEPWVGHDAAYAWFHRPPKKPRL